MSIFSGRCDVADHIAGMGGWFDKNGKSVQFNDPDVHCFYSDEMLDFAAFKKATGGVIHQHKRIKEVNEWNQEFIKLHCPEFNYREIEIITPSGKTKKSFIYTYYEKEYTAKELKKKGGVFITIDIHFNTILDLIKYYPYTVSVSYSKDEKQVVYITNESFVDTEAEGLLQSGHESTMKPYYDKKLQDHYFEICRDYLCKDLDERVCIEDINAVDTDDTGNYYCEVKFPVDTNHNIKFVWVNGKTHSHWTEPTLLRDNIVEISKEDYEDYLKEDIKNGTVKLRYVRDFDEDERPHLIG